MKTIVGNDEFCLKCMEWREYDGNGRCKICNSIIHKFKTGGFKQDSSNFYDIESPFESGENNVEDNIE
jgi:hypothetical protein